MLLGGVDEDRATEERGQRGAETEAADPAHSKAKVRDYMEKKVETVETAA